MDSDVASTARVTAALRAGETARANALFQDPWAAALAGPDLLATFAAQPPDIQDRASSYTIIRTRVYSALGKPFAWCFTRKDLERRLHEPLLQPEPITLATAA